MEKIAVGLDIGTTKIVAIVGKRNEFGKIEIIGMGKAPSLGVQRGVVTNIVQTVDSIQRATALAEEIVTMLRCAVEGLPRSRRAKACVRKKVPRVLMARQRS